MKITDLLKQPESPVFKKLGIIDQWGNGLQLIADELKNYPEIELKWFERGIQFQIQFINKALHSSEKINLVPKRD